MVKVSIFSFLLGLAIYQGLVWMRSLDSMAGVGDSRKVFITFIIANGVCLLFSLLTFSTKKIENLLRIGRTSAESAYCQDVKRHSHSERRQSPQLKKG